MNGLNLIPMGELDGGRIAHSLWGRRAASRISVVLTLALGLAGIVDSLALYWILLIRHRSTNFWVGFMIPPASSWRPSRQHSRSF